jgi:hypothetical protein
MPYAAHSPGVRRAASGCLARPHTPPEPNEMAFVPRREPVKDLGPRQD